MSCLLSPTLFNSFIEHIVTDALEHHSAMVSTGGGNIANLRFADDIDGPPGSEEELVNLVKSLVETSSRYGMKISAEKNTELMTNSSTPVTTKFIVRAGKNLKL